LIASSNLMVKGAGLNFVCRFTASQKRPSDGEGVPAVFDRFHVLAQADFIAAYLTELSGLTLSRRQTNRTTGHLKIHASGSIFRNLQEPLFRSGTFRILAAAERFPTLASGSGRDYKA
jgi:hypothetical protein